MKTTGVARIFLILMLLALPSAVSAQSTTELLSRLAELQRLLSQISLLQQQPAGISRPFTCLMLPRNLVRGNNGSDVMELQRFLGGEGLLTPDGLTGFFGPMTENAVRSYQRQQRIVSSGSPSTTGYGAVGSRTRAAIANCGASTARNTTTTGGPQSYAYSPSGDVSSAQSPVPNATSNTQSPSYGAADLYGQQSGNSTGVSTGGSSSGGNSYGPSHEFDYLYDVPASGGGNSGGSSSTGSSASTGGTNQTPANDTQTSSTANGSSVSQSQASCSFNGSPVQNGSTVTAYAEATVPSGQPCLSQRRTCANGVLSGSYSQTTCTVIPTASFQVTTIPAHPAAQKPYMGFNTYYANRVGRFQVNQNAIIQIGKDMRSSGMIAAGYKLLGFDIGWWFAYSGSPRDAATHRIVPSPLITDLGGLISQLHGMGLSVGAYTDPGTGDAAGCGGFPGSGGYIEQDVRQMADWGFDFLKLDHCGGNPHAGTTGPYNGADAEYQLWSNAILNTARATGKQMVFNIADFDGVSSRTPGWAPLIGNSWRTQTDIANQPDFPVTWQTILRSFYGNDVPPAAGPGHWNDPDYLLIGGFGLTPTEEQSNLNMWAIAAAPLVLGTYPADLISGSDAARLKAMLLNSEVIGIDQDVLGRQGEKVREEVPGNSVYSKILSGGGKRAVLFLNENNTSATIAVRFGELGLQPNSVAVRDVVSHTDLGTYNGSFSVSNIPPHGTRLLVVQGADAPSGIGLWQSLSKKILGAPAVVKNGNEVASVVLGLDRYYWVRSISGSGSQNWSRIRPDSCGGDVIFFGEPSLSVANGAINVTGLGYIDSPRAKYIDAISAFTAYSYDNGKSWSCYGDLGKPAVGLNGRVSSASITAGMLDVIARGGDNALWYKRYSQGSWGGWGTAGACAHSGVSVSTRPSGVVDIVVIGCEDKVWHGWYTSSPAAINWEAIPSQGTFTGEPASIWNDALGQYVVYATATDGRDVQKNTWNSVSGWSGWSSLGGCSKSGISATGGAQAVLMGIACSVPNMNSNIDAVGDTPIYLLQ